MNPEELQSILAASLPDCTVDVSGAGSHFDITVVGDIFEGLNAVKKQQLVYAGLNEHIAGGAVHAVNIKTYTPAEWAQNNG